MKSDRSDKDPSFFIQRIDYSWPCLILSSTGFNGKFEQESLEEDYICQLLIFLKKEFFLRACCFPLPEMPLKKQNMRCLKDSSKGAFLKLISSKSGYVQNETSKSSSLYAIWKAIFSLHEIIAIEHLMKFWQDKIKPVNFGKIDKCDLAAMKIIVMKQIGGKKKFIRLPKKFSYG